MIPFPYSQALLTRRRVAAGNTDPNFANVALLLHMNGTNGSTTFTDSSGTPKTVTPSGNAQISTANSKFGGASGLFDGNGDYLTPGSSTNWKFLHDGTSWTIEGWYRFASFSTSPALFSTAATTTAHGMLAYLNTSRQILVQIYRGVDSTYVINGTTTGTVTNDSNFHHIAITFDLTPASANCIVYIDGTQAGSFNKTANAPSSSNPTNNLRLGAYAGFEASGNFNGNMDDVRITNGVVRYTGSFTPPTAQFPDS